MSSSRKIDRPFNDDQFNCGALYVLVSSTEADSSKSKLFLIFSFNEIEKSADYLDWKEKFCFYLY